MVESVGSGAGERASFDMMAVCHSPYVQLEFACSPLPASVISESLVDFSLVLHKFVACHSCNLVRRVKLSHV